VDKAIGVVYSVVSTGFHLHSYYKSALLATATTSAAAITRGHLLVLVADLDDEDVTVLYTITVGVLPAVAANVVVPATAGVTAEKLSNVAPPIRQYPL
jgi:hypothetical protein